MAKIIAVNRSRSQKLSALLRDLGPQLRRGGAPVEAPPHFATGIPDLDRLLGGGFPRGRLSEIAGPASSGRTSVALALIARITRAGEVLALVDFADAFDPASAEAAGVRLECVLWVRARHLREALASTTRLLETRGFALVVLDLIASEAKSGEVQPDALSNWLRLSKTAAASGTALIVMSNARVTRTAADLALEMKPARARFRGIPPLLEGLEIEAVLVRHRTVPLQRTARVRLCA